MGKTEPIGEKNESDLLAVRTKSGAVDSFSSAGSNRVIHTSEAIAQTVGNLALKPDPNVLEFKPKAATKLEAVPEVKKETLDENSLATSRRVHKAVLEVPVRVASGADNRTDFLPASLGESQSGKNGNRRRVAKPKTAKTESTKAEADWLKRSFPVTIEGATGSWNVRTDCAGFNVYFRVKAPVINLKFPRISREMFLTLKGMNDAERKERIAKYVSECLVSANQQGDDRARAVAARLHAAS